MLCSIWFEVGGELSKEMKSVIKQKVKGMVQGNETFVFNKNKYQQNMFYCSVPVGGGNTPETLVANPHQTRKKKKQCACTEQKVGLRKKERV